MTPLAHELAGLRVRVRLKSSSWLMRLIGLLLGQRFMTRAWTTIGTGTIFAPAGTDLERIDAYEGVIEHELVHIEQARRWPLLWQFSYLFVPLPIGLAWFRWRWEREAYLVQIRSGATTIEQVVDTLWRHYGWPWPRKAMRRWFFRQVAVAS